MPNTPAALFKSSIPLLCVWVAILGVAYLVLESLFFCCTSYLFPYYSRVNLGFGIYPLLQTSKSSVAPQKYTAIFGDSYAFGEGDWFLEVQQKSNPVFNTTHLLHNETGKDFISFGIPGSGNLCGWIEDPMSSMNYINAGYRYHLPDPENIILYFYEGNDIDESLGEFQSRYIERHFDPAKLGDPDYFAKFINEEILDRNQINLKSRNMDIAENLYFFKQVTNTIHNTLDNDGTQKRIMDALEELKVNPPKKQKNLAKIAGAEVFLPDGLGVPPIRSPAIEIDQSLAFIDQIVRYTRKKFSNSTLMMVYIPSPALSYDIISDNIDIYQNPENQTFKKKAIFELSNTLCQRMQSIAEKNGIAFLDARSAIHSEGQNKILHGIGDTGHFNENGYRALANAIKPFFLNVTESGNDKLVSPCASMQ